MEITQLNNKEQELYAKVLQLYNKEGNSEGELQKIFEEYRQVHIDYSKLAATDIEALKRGLFIQWYALTEPIYLTGISDLDQQAELRIIELLNGRIESNELDQELKWMSNYYFGWDWVFERFDNFESLTQAISNHTYSLPKRINRLEMEQRGQMGSYWNSLTVFS